MCCTLHRTLHKEFGLGIGLNMLCILANFNQLCIFQIQFLIAERLSVRLIIVQVWQALVGP